MAARETLGRALGRGLTLLNEPRVRRGGQVVACAGLMFLIISLARTWHQGHASLGAINWFFATGAILAATASVAVAALAWTRIMRVLGVNARWGWASIYLVSQLAKYVPGGVWHYAGRAALARTVGAPARKTALSVSVELCSALAAAGALALLLLDSWGLVGAAAAVSAGAVALWRSWPSLPPTPRALGVAVLAYVPSIAFAGVSLWLVAQALLPAAGGGLVFYVGAWAAAWLVGVIAFFAPGGVGIREALLVTLLRPHVGTADAVAVAAASRLVVTSADAVSATIGAFGRRDGGALREPPLEPALDG